MDTSPLPPPLTPNTPIARRVNVLVGPIGSQQVMFDADKGESYTLNPIASMIWDLLARPLSSNEVSDALLQTFDVEPEVCRTETYDLIREMYALGLVVQSPRPID